MYQFLTQTKVLKSITIKNLNTFTESKTIPLYSKAISGWKSSLDSPDGIIVPSIIIKNQDPLKKKITESKKTDTVLVLSLYNINGSKEFDVSESINLDNKNIDEQLKKALTNMDTSLETGKFPKKINLSSSRYPKERLSFINSVPSGKIYINKKYYGSTPLISYLPQKDLVVRVVSSDKEYNPLSVNISKDDLPLFLIDGRSLMLEKDYLSRAKKLKSKNKKEAISLLEQIPSSYSYYPRSQVMLADLLLKDKEYRKVIEKTSFILSDRKYLQSEEKNKDKMNLYLLNNIASINYAVSLKEDMVQEKTEYYRDALIDGEQIFKKLKGTDKLDQSLDLGESDLVIDFWYYQGVAALRLWQQSNESEYKDKLVDIWQNFLASKKIDNYSSLNKEQKAHVQDARKLYEYLK